MFSKLILQFIAKWNYFLHGKKNKTLHLFSLFNYKIQKYDSTCLHPDLVIYTQVEKKITQKKSLFNWFSVLTFDSFMSFEHTRTLNLIIDLKTKSFRKKNSKRNLSCNYSKNICTALKFSLINPLFLCYSLWFKSYLIVWQEY